MKCLAQVLALGVLDTPLAGHAVCPQIHRTVHVPILVTLVRSHPTFLPPARDQPVPNASSPGRLTSSLLLNPSQLSPPWSRSMLVCSAPAPADPTNLTTLPTCLKRVGEHHCLEQSLLGLLLVQNINAHVSSTLSGKTEKTGNGTSCFYFDFSSRLPKD